MMNIHSYKGPFLGALAALVGLLSTEIAAAQEAPIAPTPAPAPVEPAPAPIDVAPAPVVAPAPPPPPLEPVPLAEVPPPPPPADNPFKITTGAGLRVGFRLQNPNTKNSDGNFVKLNDQFVDELNAELRFSGKVTDIVGWTANLTVDGRTRAQSAQAGGGPITFQAQAMDVIGQLDFQDEFHVWLGRMLTPSDRSNFSGAWFMAPWNYSGVLDGYFGPRGTEEVGRDVGATVWGDIGKGKFKYYAAVLDLDNNVNKFFGDGAIAPSGGFAGQSPLYSLRAQYAFLGSEPGFYGSSTYYGGQTVVALGAAFQYQNDFVLGTGDAEPGPEIKDDLVEFNADFLGEFVTPGGTPGLEAAYYHESGDSRGFNDFFFVTPGFTTKDNVGPGKINATVRFQLVKTGEDANKSTHTIVEPSIAYLFKDYFAKLQLTYSNGRTTFEDAPTSKYQFLQLGFQVQQ